MRLPTKPSQTPTRTGDLPSFRPIPIAVLTSWPSFGRLLIRWQMLSLPEEIAPPAALRPLDLEVLRYKASPTTATKHD